MTFPKFKVLILVFAILVVTVLFWRQLSLFFDSATLNGLIRLGVYWLAFLTFSLVFLILIDNRNVVYLTYLLGVGSFFLFFVFLEKTVAGVYAICLLILFLFLIIAYERINKEKEARLKISLKITWRKGLPLIILGISLIATVVYYFNPLIRLNQGGIEIPRQFFNLVTKPFSEIVGKMLPFYDSKMTIDEILTAGAVMESGIPSAFDGISPDLTQKLAGGNFKDINQLLQDPEVGDLLRQEIKRQTQKKNESLLQGQRAEIEEGLGITLNGDETLDEILVKVVNGKIGEFIGPYAKEISLGISLALFSVLILVGKIFSFVIIILARIIFNLFLIFRIVRKRAVMKRGEIIEI